MRRKLFTLTAAGLFCLALTGSALAFDCIRVSSSLQGLQNRSSPRRPSAASRPTDGPH